MNVLNIIKSFFPYIKKEKRISWFCNLLGLVLSLDVIFHLIEDNVYYQYMNNLFNASFKYVTIYSSNYELQTEAVHVRHRRFTDYLEKNYSKYKLFNVTKNKYPFDLNDPDNTSFADFYFFRKDIKFTNYV